VLIEYNGWTNNKYSNFSKNKGPLLKLRLQAIRELDYHKRSIEWHNSKRTFDRTMYVKEVSYCSIGLYRLYKNQIYKLCNKI